MQIRNLFLLALVVILSGCVSYQPLPPEQLASLRAGNTAVIVYDSAKKLTYTDQTFYGIGAAFRDTKATYEGVFDLESLLSENFAKQLNQRGLKAKAVSFPHATVEAGFNEQFFTPPVTRIGSEPKDVETKKLMPSFLKDAVSNEDFNYAFFVSSSGPSVTTNNFSGNDAYISSSSDVYLYNTKSGSLVWSASLWIFADIFKFKSSPKEVEENDLSALKPILAHHVELLFTLDAPAQKGLDTGMGLKPQQ